FFAPFFPADACVLPFPFEPATFLTTVLAGVFGASLLSFSPSSGGAGVVSPKWIGAFLPADPLPSPNPPPHPTAAMLDLGGVTSAFGLSHLAAILWHSSPVQYTPSLANSAGGMGEFSAKSRSLVSNVSMRSSISFLLLASSNFSPVRNFSYKTMGSRAFQYSNISFGTYSAGSCCACPRMRIDFASIKMGPSRARGLPLPLWWCTPRPRRCRPRCNSQCHKPWRDPPDPSAALAVSLAWNT